MTPQPTTPEPTLPTPGAPVVVGDIGGTNARFALVDHDGHIVRQETYKVADYPSFQGALTAFLTAAGGDRPVEGCFAVAGPVTAGRAAFTNSPWEIDASALEANFGLKTALVVNDWKALSRFAAHPGGEDRILIKHGTPILETPVVTIGPGTGLGQGLLVPGPAGPVAVSTEGGHVRLAPATASEAAILDAADRRLGHYPSAEDLVSGRGLVNLSRAMADAEGRPCPARNAQEIGAGAMEGETECVAILTQFCAFLGTVAGNACLSAGARGGVMLAGGILPRYPQLLKDSPFTARFIGDSPMTDYLRAIPVTLLTAGDGALRGAASLLRDLELAKSLG